MGAVALQITSLTTVYSTIDSDADQRKHQSSASLAFVRGNHRGPVNSPHKWPVTRKIFPFDDVIIVTFNVVDNFAWLMLPWAAYTYCIFTWFPGKGCCWLILFARGTPRTLFIITEPSYMVVLISALLILHMIGIAIWNGHDLSMWWDDVAQW